MPLMVPKSASGRIPLGKPVECGLKFDRFDKGERTISTFRKLDVDGDGRLSDEELKQAFKKLGARFPSFRAYLARKFADSDRDGFIDFHEFDDLIVYAIQAGFTLDAYTK